MTLLELKKLCKERGLRVSGKKDDVIIRLMESDEVEESTPFKAPPNASLVVPPGMQPQPQYLLTKENGMMKFIGTLVILYGFFRIGWSIMFSAGSVGVWILSPLGLLIGMSFVFGGFLIYAEYRNGVYFTLCVLLLSGIMSLIFHADNWDSLTPVSAPLVGESMLMTSSMCSISCLGIVALPLVFSLGELKSGWPPGIQKLLDSLEGIRTGNVEVECTSCNKTLLIPINYSGDIKCPNCQEQMSV